MPQLTMYREDIDYQLVMVREDKQASVKILKGKFEGVTYTYGKVSLPEKKPEKGQTLRFIYCIEEPCTFTKEHLTESQEFKNHIGDILQDIIIESGNAKKYERKYSVNNTKDSSSE